MTTAANPRYLIGISLIAACGGFLFGFDMTVISGAIPFLKEKYQLSGANLGWAASSCVFACIFGAAFAGKLADAYGRKKVLLATSILFAISSVGAGWVNTFFNFSAFRLMAGVAVGAASGVAPIYIAEMAPTRFRGRLVSFYQLAIVVGLCACYYSNYLLLRTGADAWRWMFTVGVVPSLLFFVFLFIVPETPRWLVKRGFAQQALEILARVDGVEYARTELLLIQETLRDTRRASLTELLKPRVLRLVVIGSLLGIFSQLSGANAVFLYAPDIFSRMGAGLESSLRQSSLIGLILFVATFFPIAFVEKFGRRPILMTGVGLMAVLLIALTFLLHSAPTHAGLILTLLLGYIAAYASSIACLTWVILSEIFPNRLRGEAMSIANLSLWSANFLQLLVFPVIVERFGIAAPFAAYAVVCVIIVGFVWRFIPETKGKSLEELELQMDRQ